MKNQDDAWSSLDEDEESQSFVVSDSYSSSSDSSSDSESSSSSSSSSRSEPDIKRPKISQSAMSTRAASPACTPRRPVSKEPSSVRPDTTSRKDERRMLLDSLAKRRRLSTGARAVDMKEVSESLSDESSDFVVSDNEIEEFSNGESFSSGSSSEEMEGPGFYSRISEMISRKERNDKSISDTMSTREAFKTMMASLAVRLVSPNCEFPDENKKLRKQLPTFKAAQSKIERELLTRRDISKPNYWRPSSLFVRAIEAYPELHLMNMRNYFASREMDEECEACHRKGWTTDVSFRGTAYDSGSLWRGNLQKWLTEIHLPHLAKGKSNGSSNSESDSFIGSDVAAYASSGHMLGTQCAFNVRVYHELHHFKHKILCKLYNWLVKHRLTRSIEAVLGALEAQKDGEVEEWFSAYERVINLSEMKFDKFTDPLGNYSPTKDVRKSISVKAESRRRKSSRF